MKTHVFNGRKYDINIMGTIDGITDVPRSTILSLVICTDLETKRGLETAIHESMHACNYMKREESVKQAAKDIARFLWRLGFRYDRRSAR